MIFKVDRYLFLDDLYYLQGVVCGKPPIPIHSKHIIDPCGKFLRYLMGGLFIEFSRAFGEPSASTIIASPPPSY
jgi:hypothetical protein